MSVCGCSIKYFVISKFDDLIDSIKGVSPFNGEYEFTSNLFDFNKISTISFDLNINAKLNIDLSLSQKFKSTHSIFIIRFNIGSILILLHSLMKI